MVAVTVSLCELQESLDEMDKAKASPRGVQPCVSGPSTPSDLSEADEDEWSESEGPALPVVLPDSPAKLVQECVDQWEEQGSMSDHDAHECAALAVRFCVGLSLVSWPACRVALTCVRMLAECNYGLEDIQVTLAMALATIRSPRSAKFMSGMGPQEKLLVAMLHVYCAHAVVCDEFVHFSIWHEWLFAPTCSVKTSTNALVKICTLRRWRFLVPDDLLDPVLEEFRNGNAEMGI